jgi:hypothetical protein
MRPKFFLIAFISISSIISLLLALFLAPLRTSFSQYSGNIAYQGLVAAGVNFNAVNNMRKVSYAAQYEAQSLEIQNTKNGHKKVNARTYSNLFGFSTSGSYVAKQNMNKTETPNGGSSGAVSLANGGRGSKNNPESSITTSGFIASLTDLTGNEGTTTRQSVNGKPVQYGPGQGGTQPGLDMEPPIGNLPVGDGVYIMVMMAIGFGSWKEWKCLKNK